VLFNKSYQMLYTAVKQCSSDREQHVLMLSTQVYYPQLYIFPNGSRLELSGPYNKVPYLRVVILPDPMWN
jgi:hypothetical protein